MRKSNNSENKMSVFYQIRQKTGMNQEELSRLLGVNVTTLSRWENGRNQPSLDFKQIKTLSILLRGMGLQISDLPDSAFGKIENLILNK